MCLVTKNLIADSTISYLASSPAKMKRAGYTCKIPACAMSADFIWSRGITFVH